MKNKDFYRGLYENFNLYREKSLKNRRFNYDDIAPLLNKYARNRKFKVTKIGDSVESRGIHEVKIGKGKTKVLLWSQMHGNESTATMTFFDFYKFMITNDEFTEQKKEILDNLTLHFIPMLNPDGAEQFIRENALGIDINRDAIQLQTPEGRLLDQIRRKIKPTFAFNLHDQDIHHRVEKTGKPATFSFLSPSFNEEKSVNESRGNAMQLIVELNEMLQEFIPGQVARYEDDYNPKCFGDFIQSEGISTILIENGGLINDVEKQKIRRLNFVTIVKSLHSIATKKYEKSDAVEYTNIPEHKDDFYDLIVRDVRLRKDNQLFQADIAINRYEENLNGKHFYFKNVIEKVGDLDNLKAYEEFDANGMELSPGKIFPKTLNNINKLKDIDEIVMLHLLDLGFTTLKVRDLPIGRDFSQIPVHLIHNKEKVDNEIKVEGKANFTLLNNGEVQAAVINGILYDFVEE